MVNEGRRKPKPAVNIGISKGGNLCTMIEDKDVIKPTDVAKGSLLVIKQRLSLELKLFGTAMSVTLVHLYITMGGFHRTSSSCILPPAFTWDSWLGTVYKNSHPHDTGYSVHHRRTCWWLCTRCCRYFSLKRSFDKERGGRRTKVESCERFL